MFPLIYKLFFEHLHTHSIIQILVYTNKQCFAIVFVCKNDYIYAQKINKL